MNIDSIKNGYVLDHIKAGKAMEIYEQLGLSSLDCQVALITNAKSKKMGRKDIIKIDRLIDIDLDKLGFIDPNITVDIVENEKLMKKKKIGLPEKIVNVAKCKNPRCITSVEKDLDQIFVLTDRDNQIYRCQYRETSLKD